MRTRPAGTFPAGDSTTRSAGFTQEPGFPADPAGIALAAVVRHRPVRDPNRRGNQTDATPFDALAAKR